LALGSTEIQQGGHRAPGSLARNMARFVANQQPTKALVPTALPSGAPPALAHAPAGALKVNMLRLIQSGEVGRDDDPL
jgi:hypothetical protein